LVQIALAEHSTTGRS